MTADHGLLDWTDDGQPRSRRFGDVYFSAEDGLAEARTVFLTGCGLPGAWRGHRRFVVGELGFGTGLNVAALLDLWKQTRPAGGVLHIFSVEAFPVHAGEAARALSLWPELAEVAAPLIAGWPVQAPGRHRLEIPGLSAILDLAVMDVTEALTGWTGRADAWFLDGFSPALNPDMWRDEVLALVAARSVPGARAATFTVAGQVRRGLGAAGFAVEKRPGFGRKRERLEAVLPGGVPGTTSRRIAIVGGGIAGAAAARAVRALGGEAVLIEAHHPGAGASGNPAALVTPRLDAGLGEAARLFAQAFARAGQLYGEVAGGVIAQGALQFATDARDVERHSRIAASDLFPPQAMTLLGGPEASARMGEASLGPALDQPGAVVVEPGLFLQTWGGEIVSAQVEALTPDGEGWRLLDADGIEIVRADAVILAAALDTARLAPGLPLSAVRGQASWTADTQVASAAAFGGYVTPTRSGILFGSTHDRDDTGNDVRPEDHARNLATLNERLPRLTASVSESNLEGRASVRAVSQDMTPLAGETDRPEVYVLTGFGSRGFSLAPLLAEHVAALAMGAPSPISAAAADLVAPGRFARRAARRGRS